MKTFGNINSRMGKLPGTILYTGKSDLDTKMVHYQYKDSNFEILDHIGVLENDLHNLIVVEGFKDKQKITNFATELEINNFYIEDIFNTTQRNKFESINNQSFLVIKYPFVLGDEIEFRRIYFLLKRDVVIVFTDYENKYMNMLLDRVKNEVQLFTYYNESYLVYAIYDLIIDEQLEMVRVLKEELEELETILLQTRKSLSNDLYKLHKQLVQLKNNVRSIKDNIPPKGIFQTDMFSNNLTSFVTDLEDHVINLYEKLNTSVDMCNSLITMYSTQLSNRTNEIMKTLTIISVIFIPLSFLAGVFGMNFTNFELLTHPNGLLIFALLSGIIAMIMLLWFKFRKWV